MHGLTNAITAILPGQASVRALIIPGNPGSAAFYAPFAEALSAAWHGKLEVTILSQLGHGVDNTNQVSSCIVEMFGSVY